MLVVNRRWCIFLPYYGVELLFYLITLKLWFLMKVWLLSGRGCLIGCTVSSDRNVRLLKRENPVIELVLSERNYHQGKEWSLQFLYSVPELHQIKIGELKCALFFTMRLSFIEKSIKDQRNRHFELTKERKYSMISSIYLIKCSCTLNMRMKVRIKSFETRKKLEEL